MEILAHLVDIATPCSYKTIEIAGQILTSGSTSLNTYGYGVLETLKFLQTLTGCSNFNGLSKPYILLDFHFQNVSTFLYFLDQLLIGNVNTDSLYLT